MDEHNQQQERKENDKFFEREKRRQRADSETQIKAKKSHNVYDFHVCINCSDVVHHLWVPSDLHVHAQDRPRLSYEDHATTVWHTNLHRGDAATIQEKRQPPNRSFIPTQTFVGHRHGCIHPAIDASHGLLGASPYLYRSSVCPHHVHRPRSRGWIARSCHVDEDRSRG